MEGFLNEVSGSAANSKALAGMFFYGFFLPHEIGHAFQHHTNSTPANDFDAEYQASELAVTYWRSKGKQKELQQCYEMAKNVLKRLKNPIPENVDAKKYMTDHYNELLQDPYKYGYIQFSQIVKILEDQSLPDFETYVKKYVQNTNSPQDSLQAINRKTLLALCCRNSACYLIALAYITLNIM
ncbi:MAG: hypothetical protein EOO68_37850 [Moraxellaceae bacterium]|nr:MAG: hypothetical protein EOO68_37850 [Moraxellaceae bacterium]